MTKYICDKCGNETECKDTVEIKYKEWPDLRHRKTYDLCDDCMDLLFEFITGWEITRL